MQKFRNLAKELKPKLWGLYKVDALVSYEIGGLIKKGKIIYRHRSIGSESLKKVSVKFHFIFI